MLLRDRLTPITNEIGFIQLPFDDALQSYLDWRNSIRRYWPELTVTSVTGDLEAILLALQPLQTGQANRVAVVPTNSDWTAFFGNRDVDADLTWVPNVLAKRSGRQTLQISVTLSSVDDVRRECAFLDATIFRLSGPVDRHLQAYINDDDRWTWESAGPPQPYERSEYYAARRIRDRLTIEIIAEYASALGLRPFDADFYAPNGTGAIVDYGGRWDQHLPKPSLAQVQARLARGWHNPSSYDGLA